MNKYREFLSLFDELTDVLDKSEVFTDNIREVYEELQDLAEQPEKLPLTESGLKLLEYLQKQENQRFKAKDISEGMGISSRKISGAMRKLAADNFVSKHGQNPVIYSLTDKGKEFNLKDYKERINNEENN